LYFAEAAASHPTSSRVSFVVALGSPLTVVLRRRRNGSIDCSYRRQKLFEFRSQWIRGNGVCCQDPIRIAHLKDLPRVTNCTGFSHFGVMSESRSTTRPIRDWAPQVTLRFQVLEIWLRLERKVSRTSLIAGIAAQAAGGLHRGHTILIPSNVVPILRVAFALGRRRRIAPCPHSGLTR
jgi:hypothetical protein